MVSRRVKEKFARDPAGGSGSSDATLEPRFNPGSRSAIAAKRRAGGARERVCWRKVWQDGRLRAVKWVWPDKNVLASTR